jgi:hypothetical protein
MPNHGAGDRKVSTVSLDASDLRLSKTSAAQSHRKGNLFSWRITYGHNESVFLSACAVSHKGLAAWNAEQALRDAE